MGEKLHFLVIFWGVSDGKLMRSIIMLAGIFLRIFIGFENKCILGSLVQANEIYDETWNMKGN